MFGVGERMKRSLDIGAGSAGITLRPRRQISGESRVKGRKQNDSSNKQNKNNNHNPRGY